MEWSDISGAVANATPALGSALAGPAGGAVGGLIASALGSKESPDAVSQALESNPEAAAKLQALEQEHQREIRSMTLEAETQRIKQINKTMRAELGADSGYRAGWRPTFGYAAALAWVAQIGGVVYAMVANPEYAADLINSITALTPMWSVALAVLGVNIRQRSRDKEVAAGGKSSGMFDGIASLVRNRNGSD
jgi:hypothetical protein